MLDLRRHRVNVVGPYLSSVVSLRYTWLQHDNGSPLPYCLPDRSLIILSSRNRPNPGTNAAVRALADGRPAVLANRTAEFPSVAFTAAFCHQGRGAE